MNKELRFENFKKKSSTKHNNFYDYSLVDYINIDIKVKIICPLHGVFEQSPDSHSQGHGCSKCASDKIRNSVFMSKEDFVERANKIHNFFYDYSKFSKEAKNRKTVINCPIHGEFEQNKSDHLSGKGCKECGNIKKGKSKTKSKESFLKDAKIVHGELYDYSKSDYTFVKSKIEISCKIHGSFLQTPDNHLQGQGCPKCGKESNSLKFLENPTGWSYTNWELASKKSKNFESFQVYFIKCFNEKETFYKIGRTYQNINKRFSKNNLPYSYEVLNIWEFKNARDCCNVEKLIKNNLKDFKYLPEIYFKGYGECFKIDKEINATKMYGGISGNTGPQ